MLKPARQKVSLDRQGGASYVAGGRTTGGRRSLPISREACRIFCLIGLVLLDALVILGVPALLAATIEALGTRYDPLVSLSILPIYFAIAANKEAYGVEALAWPGLSARSAMASAVIAQISMLVMIFFLKQSSEVSRLSLGIGVVATVLGIGVARALFGRMARYMCGGFFRSELVICDGVEAEITKPGATTVPAKKIGLIPDLNDPQMLNDFGLIARNYDRIVIASEPARQANWAFMLKGANIAGEILVEQANSVGAFGIGSIDGRETLIVSHKPLNLTSRANKRALDLAVTIPLLILLFPVMLLTAIAVKLDSPGPILFKQDRIGRGNCQFKVLKFRSMRTDASDARGNRSASRDDDRITRVGRIIRSSSLDELPQLLNVLLGDMSLVGPRPHALGSTAEERLFWEVDQSYWHRHQLKPGITGLAQIRGHRGATNTMGDLTDRLQADMEYVEGWDIWRDIGILFQTVRVVFHKNAY